MRDHCISPVEEPVAGRAHQDVAAVQVVVLDARGDTALRELRGGSRDIRKQRRQPRAHETALIAFVVVKPFPPSIVVEEACQLPGECLGAPVRNAGT